MFRLAVILSLVVGSGCDRPDEEAVKQIVGAAVQDNFAGVREDQAELATANAALRETIESQTQVLDGMASKVDKLQTRVAELEATATAPGVVPAVVPAVVAATPRPTYYKVELGDAQTRGKATALVTVVQWSDFQCPHCGRVGSTLDELSTKYGDDVRFAFQHYPLPMHDRAMPAAVAAEAAAEQDKFWEMHDKLFDNYTDLTDKNFVAWAKDLGLDVPRFKGDMKDPAIERRIKAMRDAGTDLGLVGTPDFYVNGRHVEDGNTVEAFSALIDEELVRARALVASGVARADVYEKTIAGGETRLE